MTEVLLQESVLVDFIQPSSSSLPTDKRLRGCLLNLKVEAREIENGKEFVVSVSREDEVCFIYSLSLRRSDYERLKEEQNLEAEFDSFPTMIYEFVKDMKDNNESRLEGRLKGDKSEFKLEMICKMNAYKRVTLLSLRLGALSNQELISYLANKISNLKILQAELDGARDSLARENQKSRELKNTISNAVKELNELRLEHDKEKKKREDAENELEKISKDLKELEALRKENDDFREQIDNLLDEQERMEEEKDRRISELEEELDNLTAELELKDDAVEKLEAELDDLESKLAMQLDELEPWKKKACEYKKDRDQLREECDHWKTEQKKAVEILERLCRQQRRKSLPEDDNQKRIRELEKDVEERKATIDSLTDSVAQLRNDLELSRAECAKAKKAAEDWESKYEKKEKMLGDFLQLRRASPITNQMISSPMDYVPGHLVPYKRVLGRHSTLTGPISTPLRDLPYASQPSNLNFSPPVALLPSSNGQSQPSVFPPTALQAPMQQPNV